jgi:uncharacterized protein (DUF2267 family)
MVTGRGDRRRTIVALAAAGSGVLLVLRWHPATRRWLRRLARTARRRAAYQRGRLAGVRYRLAGRHPEPNVSDAILADRVRSVLGPLEQRLDIPRVHVTCHEHVVFLHGNIDSEEAARALVDAVRAVSGVRAVRSELHVGLSRGDTRPSQGRAHRQPSTVRTRLLQAAVEAGPAAEDAAGVVLSAFLQRIPQAERRHVLGQLPQDVRTLASQPTGAPPVNRLEALGAAVAVRTGVRLDSGKAIAMAVLHELRKAVPDEAEDIGAVLPRQLRDVWARVASTDR